MFDFTGTATKKDDKKPPAPKGAFDFTGGAPKKKEKAKATKPVATPAMLAAAAVEAKRRREAEAAPAVAAPPPGVVAPAFAEEHPMATKVLETVSAPLRWAAGTRPGQFLTRAGEQAADVALMTPRTELGGAYTPLPTGRQETAADIVGMLGGMIVPIGGAYATGGQLATRAGQKLLPKAGPLAQMGIRGAGAGATYGTAEAVLDDGSLKDVARSAAIHSALFGVGDPAVTKGLQLAGRGLQAAARPVAQRLGRAAPEVPKEAPDILAQLRQRMEAKPPEMVPTTRFEQLTKTLQKRLGTYETPPVVATREAAEKTGMARKEAVIEASQKIARSVRERASAPNVAPKAVAATYKPVGNTKEFTGRILKSVEGWLSSKGDPGNQILRMSREVERISDTKIAEQTTSTISKVAKLSREEQLNMRSVIRGKAKPMNDRVKEAAKSVEAYYNERPNRIKQAGLTLRTLKGEDIPFQEAKDHFPLRLDWKKIEDATGQIKPEVLQQLVKTGQAKNIQEADRMLKRLRRMKYERHATFQHESKKIDLPGYELDPLVAIQSDLAEGELRIAQAMQYDVKDERLIAAIEQMAPQDQEYALKVADRLKGQDARARVDQHIIEGLLSYNVISKLGLAMIPNATQNVNTVLRLGAVSLIKGIKAAVKNRKEAEQFAAAAGIHLDPANIALTVAEARGGPSLYATKFLQATGFNATEYWNRLVSSQAARGWAEDMFKALKKPGSVSWVQRIAGKQPARIKRLFRNSGVDIDAALKRGSLTEEELAKVARYNVIRTQFPASQLDVPLWASSPWGRVVFQFKRYAFNQGRLLQRELFDEAVRFFRTGGKDGSLRAWGPFLTLFPSAGWLVGLIRDSISGKELPGARVERLGEAVSDRDVRALVLEYLDAYTWVGGLGIASDTAKQLSWDERTAIVTLLGPSAGVAESVLGIAKPGVTAIQRIAAGEELKPEQLRAQALRALVRGNVPIAGYQAARGEWPFGVESDILKAIFQPSKVKKE